MEPTNNEQKVPNNDIAVSPNIETKVNKQKGSLTTFFAFAVIIVSIIAGFFAYQNQKLVKELREKTQPSQSPEIVSTPTTDPTINWETYVNSKYGFSFRHPDNYKVEERVPGFIVVALSNEVVAQGGISFEARLQKPYNSFDYAEEYIKSSLVLSQSRKIDKWQIYEGVGKEGTIKGINFIQAIIPYKTGVIEAETIATSSYAEFFTQILSTFEYLDQSSPSPTTISKTQGCIEKTTCTGTIPCMTNPASVFCTCMGGKSTIKTAADGNQGGLCTIDGKIQDEWAYYRSIVPENNTILPR